MGFSPAVKAAALAAAGRHCCICHKFCGTKIECHHIVHESEGGPDTYDNCIPVCFDCHADMRSYDHKHPKGTKYSAAELRQHRDRWYTKVADGGGAITLPEHREVDKAVFRVFQQLVPYVPTLDYLSTCNVAGFSFRRDPLLPLFRYADSGDRVEYEFVDPELEAARGEFRDAARRFTNVVSNNSWFTHVEGMSTVPPEWEETQPERFWRVVDEIHSSARDILAAYDTIVRLARRRLGVTGLSASVSPDA